MIKIKDLESLSAFLMRYAGEPLLPLQVSEVHVIEKTEPFCPTDYIRVQFCAQNGEMGYIKFMPEDPQLKLWFEFV